MENIITIIKAWLLSIQRFVASEDEIGDELRNNRLENYFFWIVTGFNLLPVLGGEFFPTLDGPAHLYNSQLINSLLFESNTGLNNFFCLNQEPVPNWTGHLILSFFNQFLPAFLAEKILLIAFLIGLPISFRGLIKTISPKQYLLSYLIFPFTYSTVFFLGFYNFSIAVVFLFITLDCWIKKEESTFSLRKTVTLFFLITLTYFSHIFVFAILMALIGLYTALKTIVNILDNSTHLRKELSKAFNKYCQLLLASFIPVVMFLYYFYLRPPLGEYTYIDFKELLEWIGIVRPIIALSFDREQVFTEAIFYVFVLLLIFAIYKKIGLINSKNDASIQTHPLRKIKNLFTISSFWLLAAIFILVLYFKLPDSDGYAGYVSIRLGLLFFLFLILWLSTEKYPRWLCLMMVATVLYCHFNRNNYYQEATKDLNKIALECNNAAEYIVPNSVVVSLNYSDNWLHNHFSNYLGVDKPMVILENYECSTGYFPVKWKEEKIPTTLIGTLSTEDVSCNNWKSTTGQNSVVVDYVFILGNINSRTDSSNNRIKQQLIEKYKLVYNAEHCELHQHRSIEKK